ncbi:MAG TPA: hypothetical protein PLT53_13220, partial [Prolixibacteraceae bacterium]|nr:hypothetical protein [Prolixibacteraceae bacterium]
PTASNPADIVLTGCNSTFPAPDPLVVTDEADNCGVPVVAWVSDGPPVTGGAPRPSSGHTALPTDATT